MLAERVVEWTEKWKQEGLQEGLQKGLQKGRQKGLQEGLQEGLQKGLQEGRQKERQEELERVRGVLLLGLEKRFGPLPAEVRHRVEAIGSTAELVELSLRVGSAPSIAALELG